jgi:hypothetical protein
VQESTALPARPGPAALVGTNLLPAMQDAGFPFPDLPAFGRLTIKAGKFRFYRTGTAKLVLSETAEGAQEELYDLLSDPTETSSITDRDLALAHRLRQLLEAADAAGKVNAPRVVLDLDHMKQLHSLGYL